MSYCTFKNIRKAHELYLQKREEFDTAKGIISPIRAILANNNRQLAEILIRYADTIPEERQKFFRYNSKPIGIMVACKELSTGNISTAWSLCAAQDLYYDQFDKETGILMALNRLFVNRPSYSVHTLRNEHYSKSVVTFETRPIMFFGENIISDQVVTFINRCQRYYKVEEVW